MTVRTCASCKHDTAVSVRDWPSQTSFMGLSSGSGPVGRQDFRCQSCGARFTVRGAAVLRALAGPLVFLPFVGIGGMLLLGGLTSAASEPAYGLGLAAFGGLLAALSVLACMHLVGPLVQTWRNPVAPDAPVPPRRFDDTPPMRRCACGKPAPVTKIVAESTNHIPTGTESTHTCECGREFAVNDVWGLVFMSMVVAIVTVVALFCSDSLFENDATWGAFVLAGGLALLSLGGMIAWVHQVASRFWLHPLVPDAGSQN